MYREAAEVFATHPVIEQGHGDRAIAQALERFLWRRFEAPPLDGGDDFGRVCVPRVGGRDNQYFAVEGLHGR